MSTYTIRPNALLQRDGALEATSNSGGAWSTPSDATAVTALNDNSDTTGLRNPAATGMRYLRLGLAGPTIAGGEFVARVGGWLRSSHGKAGKQLGCLPYRLADTVPGLIGYLQADGGTSPTTREVSAAAVGWSVADASALGLVLAFEGASAAADRVRVWDVGATIYTLANATCVPAATVAPSTYPTINVDVTATIGWEASTYNWQNLRRVTVEVRIESGGAGVGLGTLVATATADVWFTATGTLTVAVPVGTAIPNGAYKIYARAIRHRENETAIAADQYGTYSASANLTVSFTAPTAPSLSLLANDTADTITATINPPSSAGYSNPVVTLERSADGGTTWTAVRDGTNLTATFGANTVVVDYECPRGATVLYRARTFAYLAGALNASAWTASVPTSLALDTWNLKVPQAANLNVAGVLIFGEPEEELNEDVGVFRPLGRTLPVVVSGTMTGWDGSYEAHTASEAEWQALKAVLTSQRVLFLEEAFGPSRYIRVIPPLKVKKFGTATTPRRVVGFAFVETSSPVGAAPPLASAIIVVFDGGAAATAVWDDVYDGGTASTVYWSGLLDGGSV